MREELPQLGQETCHSPNSSTKITTNTFKKNGATWQPWRGVETRAMAEVDQPASNEKTKWMGVQAEHVGAASHRKSYSFFGIAWTG